MRAALDQQVGVERGEAVPPPGEVLCLVLPLWSLCSQVPKQEAQGGLHTSWASVSIYPSSSTPLLNVQTTEPASQISPALTHPPPLISPSPELGWLSSGILASFLPHHTHPQFLPTSRDPVS